MSLAARIFDYMGKIEPNDDGWCPLDLGSMADVLGMPIKALRNHMSAAASKGRWVWVKDDNNRVIGFKDFAPPKRTHGGLSVIPRSKKKKKNGAAVAETKPAAQMRRRLIEAPHLERIAEARSAMAEFVRQFPGVINEQRAGAAIEYDTENAEQYIEEGLSLLERARWLEERNAELAAENAQLKRENDYFRKKEDPKFKEALATAGVVHAD